MGSAARRPTRLSQRPWPAILVSATLLVDAVAVVNGYVLTRTIEHTYSQDHLLFRPIVFVTVTIWPVVFAVFGLYQPGRLIRTKPGELLRLLAASIVAVLVVVVVIGYAAQSPFSRSFILVLLGSCLVNVVAGRVVTRSLALAVNEW